MWFEYLFADVEHAIGDHIASSKPNVEVHHQSEQSSQPQVPISKSHIASSNPIITSTTFVPSEQYQVLTPQPIIQSSQPLKPEIPSQQP